MPFFQQSGLMQYMKSIYGKVILFGTSLLAVGQGKIKMNC
jgi:hypothetical protein